MEIEHRVDELVHQVAADYVRHRGAEAVAHLTELAEIAELKGEGDDSAIWREIAAAAAGLLARRRGGPAQPITFAARNSPSVAGS